MFGSWFHLLLGQLVCCWDSQWHTELTTCWSWFYPSQWIACILSGTGLICLIIFALALSRVYYAGSNFTAIETDRYKPRYEWTTLPQRYHTKWTCNQSATQSELLNGSSCIFLAPLQPKLCYRQGEWQWWWWWNLGHTLGTAAARLFVLWLLQYQHRVPETQTHTEQVQLVSGNRYWWRSNKILLSVLRMDKKQSNLCATGKRMPSHNHRPDEHSDCYAASVRPRA